MQNIDNLPFFYFCVERIEYDNEVILDADDVEVTGVLLFHAQGADSNGYCDV